METTVKRFKELRKELLEYDEKRSNHPETIEKAPNIFIDGHLQRPRFKNRSEFNAAVVERADYISEKYKLLYHLESDRVRFFEGKIWRFFRTEAVIDWWFGRTRWHFADFDIYCDMEYRKAGAELQSLTGGTLIIGRRYEPPLPNSPGSGGL